MSRGRAGFVSRLLVLRTRAAIAAAAHPAKVSSSSNVLRVVAPGVQVQQQRGLSWTGQAKTSLDGYTGTSSEHTAKWMTNYDIKSPMELIAEVPPIEVGARVVACEGGRDPSLGHPVEYICLDLPEPNPCKYCGLRYVQARHDHH